MRLRSPVVLEPNFEVGFAFRANGTPSAVLVDEEWNIASQLAAGAPAVLALANGQDPQAGVPLSNRTVPTVKVGDPAPSLKLPDLNGKTIDLAGRRGMETLLLFWNPRCGFCQQMLPDLKAWEAKPPKGAPKLLVVSTGSVEENRALGLKSPVVLDQGFSVSGSFGADGTPMAVLIDARGKVASPLASGAQQVLALARTRGRAKPAAH